MDNYKYTTAEEIMSRVASVHTNKVCNITDFINWCAECEVDHIREYHYQVQFKDVKIEIVNGAAKIPCNMYRIKKVQMKVGGDLYHNYTENGAYIFVEDNVGDEISGKYYLYLTYDGLPVDAKTGLPLILKGHERACTAYCVKMLYYEDYLNEKITTDRWYVIENEFTQAVASTSTNTRYTDYAKKERYFRILANMVVDYRNYKGL